ncbi:MAG: LamG-like jellyroll fold domain-containing protein [bacterium]
MLKKSGGFTLIEFLVIISLVGLLTSIVSFGLSGVRAKSRDTQRLAEIDSLRKAIEFYYNDYGEYPEGEDWIKIEEDTEIGGPFSAAMQPYLSKIPLDPLYPEILNAGEEDEKVFSYQYQSTDDNQGYKIHVEMETEKYASYEVFSGIEAGGIVYGGDEGLVCQTPSGYALRSLADIDDKALVASSESLDVTDGSGLTLEAWVKLDALDSFHYIIDKCDSGGYCWAVTPRDPQTLEECPTVQFGDGNWLVWSGSCQTAPVVGEWTCLALTYSPSHYIVLYKNGEIIDEGALAPEHTIASNLSKDLGIIGCSDVDWCNGMDGAINELRVYGKALPPDLIAAHCAGDFSGDSAGCDGESCSLRAVWNFDEGFGGTTADDSIYENHGTLINNPQWVSVP